MNNVQDHVFYYQKIDNSIQIQTEKQRKTQEKNEAVEQIWQDTNQPYAGSIAGSNRASSLLEAWSKFA